MLDKTLERPDITLTLDRDGVIRSALPGGEFAGEGLDGWLGRSLDDTAEPEAAHDLARIVGEMRSGCEPSYVQLRQTLPSGREVPIGYTLFTLGKDAGFLAVGKNLQTVSELQNRLLQSQQARERDTWKVREIETRYRMLFDRSSEASVLVRMTNLRIVEANLEATRSLALVPGPEFYPDLHPRDRATFDSMLERIRAEGSAPSVSLRLPPGNALWSLRGSVISMGSGSYYLFQIAPTTSSVHEPSGGQQFSTEDIIQRLPDGFVVVDGEGIVRSTNHTFLDLVQIGSEAAVVGLPVRRWLSRPGADISVVADLVRRHGSVRLLHTTLQGELGSVTPVEISAVGDRVVRPEFIGILIRDVTMRPSAAVGLASHGAPPDVFATLPEDMTLKQIVRTATEEIEKRSIISALHHQRGNRTAAARRLGLSRQSLHTKLKKYNLSDK